MSFGKEQHNSISSPQAPLEEWLSASRNCSRTPHANGGSPHVARSRSEMHYTPASLLLLASELYKHR